MLARIARELFWLGRNLARAEHTARMPDGVFQFMLQGEPDERAGVRLDWEAVFAIMGVTSPEAGERREDVVRLPGLPPRRPGAPERIPRRPLPPLRAHVPNSVAASIDSLHEALHDADADPRNSDPVLRVRRLGADLEFRSHAEREGDLHETCQDIQEELQRVDRDIATAYFAGASGTMAVT